MLKLKLQYFGHLMQRIDSLEKTLMLGKIEGRRRRGQQRMRKLNGITDSMAWVWASSESWWCHPVISSSVVPFPSCLQFFPSWGFFPMSQFFTSGGQSIGVSASASVLPMNIQDWFHLGWTGWISLKSKGLFKSLLQHHSSKAPILWHSNFFIVQLSHPYMTTGKTIALTRRIFVGKVKSLLFLYAV